MVSDRLKKSKLVHLTLCTARYRCSSSVFLSVRFYVKTAGMLFLVLVLHCSYMDKIVVMVLPLELKLKSLMCYGGPI